MILLSLFDDHIERKKTTYQFEGEYPKNVYSMKSLLVLVAMTNLIRFLKEKGEFFKKNGWGKKENNIHTLSPTAACVNMSVNAIGGGLEV